MASQFPMKPARDVRGQKNAERASEYFDFQRWPEKAELKVTRNELLFWLTQYGRAQTQLHWYVRVWRFLRNPMGSGPSKAIEEPQP